jgi:NB-ARC domain
VKPEGDGVVMQHRAVRWRPSGSSWRSRVGWGLLGWALAVVCVALPVWAVTAGDLNEVAGWANILALPITVLGVVLVLDDRARVRDTADAADAGRRPWMVPPLDRMVERPELAERLVAALTAPVPTEVGLTTGLQGAGGFGKTRLATWVCHRPEIDQRYPGGLLWVTVGQEVRGADLAERINDLVFVLSGQRPAISDPDVAGAELGRLLDEREPVLLVVDDVWEQPQLRPFRVGGRCCTRLVTTRIPDLLPVDGPHIRVDAMSGDQARRLLLEGVPGLSADLADRLASLAGRWPVLLNLINGVLRRRVARGQLPQRAAAEIEDRLVTDGPVAFDPARPADRNQAVAATIAASLALLDPVDQQRYRDLAIFPEDVDIPLDVLKLLWSGCRVEALCEDLVGLGLIADHRLDPPGPRLVLHDVMHAYLQTCHSVAEQAKVHRRLTAAAFELLPASKEALSS